MNQNPVCRAHGVTNCHLCFQWGQPTSNEFTVVHLGLEQHELLIRKYIPTHKTDARAFSAIGIERSGVLIGGCALATPGLSVSTGERDPKTLQVIDLVIENLSTEDHTRVMKLVQDWAMGIAALRGLDRLTLPVILPENVIKPQEG